MLCSSSGCCTRPDCDVEPDLVVAHKWFNLAASRGNQSARVYRSELALEMAPEQIAEAQKLAREWLQTATDYCSAWLSAVSSRHLRNSEVMQR